MSKLSTHPVNKVPFNGPVSFKSITEQIARDAKKEGIDIDSENIAFVIQFLFSKRGALGGIPHFVYASITGFGKWLPDKKGVKLRKRYYKERKEYLAKFYRRSKLNKAMVKKTKELYFRYLETSTAEIKMGFHAWKKATGRKKKLDAKYRELNKLKRDYIKREEKIYGYVLTRKRK